MSKFSTVNLLNLSARYQPWVTGHRAEQRSGRAMATGEFLLYQTEDGRTRVECRFAEETLWLSQVLMAPTPCKA